MKNLKRETRIAGIDDGPYDRDSEETIIIATVCRMDGYIDAVIPGSICTDGTDSSERIGDLLGSSKYIEQIRFILSDGGCLGGFNVLDIGDLSKRLSIPVITVSDKRPDQTSFGDALRKHFSDFRDRLKIINRHEPIRIELPDGPCYIRFAGTDLRTAEEVVRRSTIHGRIPEPVRISHMIASACVRSGKGGDHGY
ncbi:MAG: DUF99 family protein [Thermoplasmatota archaeon]